MISTLYFISSIVHDAREYFGYIDIKFTTKSIAVTTINITNTSAISTVLKVKFTQGIHQRRYGLRCAPNCYPTMKYIFKKLNGYNENDCTFGGIVFFVSLSYYDYTTRHGPYCTLLNNALYDGGINDVTLSNYNTQMVLYSYNQMNLTDFDIQFLASKCEGILNACSLHEQLFKNIESDSFILRFLKRNNIMIRTITNTCLHVQSLNEPFYKKSCLITIGTSFRARFDLSPRKRVLYTKMCSGG